ncbi:MAG: DNA translocase FtsK [Cyclobacteriaceae bacterium]|nr:MAG: DNA translocase FtsK [Cyclobacteriaceae bacterium]
MVVLAAFLLVSFVSYLFTGKADQNLIGSVQLNWENLKSLGPVVENWLGLLGAVSGYIFIYRWFGIAAFTIPLLIFLGGYRVIFNKNLLPWGPTLRVSLFLVFWLGLLLGYLWLQFEPSGIGFFSGGLGFELALVMDGLLGWGTYLILLLGLIVFIIYFFNITRIFSGLSSAARERTVTDEVEQPEDDSDLVLDLEEEPVDVYTDREEILEEAKHEDTSSWLVEEKKEPVIDSKELTIENQDAITQNAEPEINEESDLSFSVVKEEGHDLLADKVENYDPTLDLPHYKYPGVDLLNDHASEKVQVTKEELEQKKDRIIETLINFKIGISSIKATIGPTVTLYEIVPEAGVKISKIKNLEDDIALSLAALGIRIIAPIPGKGTIGIEVPNKNREMVSMKSVISTEKFMKSDMELPVAWGKTISNEVYVSDLAKMPHLLMAGATGQGKSVGLNILLASLIYKKHPSQLKFVLVDPKKVELSLFNKLERHFLAKLANGDDAIITDTKMVIYTLNSLCIEMDSRYNLLKEAGCRNLKEYNAKFIKRRLLPTKGHRFLPYIVLVIDELSDLMMVAGKEVEQPIARLAQLARAIGIHLVVATQRPSVNVITGLIKANFPTRLSYRVTSKVDSRTILDTGGAEQLVGMGDMLLAQNSDIIRLQCAFVDSKEVEDVCEFVGEQRGYDSAYLLPEYEGDESGDSVSEVDLADRDVMFEEAARVIVLHQQGSTSLIQRKLKLGYNRAGRLIDQLEAAGIVGPFEGSKARVVLVPDEYSLEQLLNGIDEQNKQIT